MNEYTLASLTPGVKAAFQKQITPEMEAQFRAISGDENPMHWDDAFAQDSGGGYARHISFGMLTASLLSTLSGVYLPGRYSLIHSIENISFLKPVFAGDTLTICGEVTEKIEALRLIVVRVDIRNQHNEKVLKARMKILVLQ